jgi:acyl-CoA thioesterase I
MIRRLPTLARLGSPRRRRTLAALLLLGIAAATPILVAPTGRGAGAAIDRCVVPTELLGLGAPLPRTAERIRSGGALTIVALGSSSTAGFGASRPEFNYPSRLAAVLQARYPGVAIRVVNRGIGGELAPQMLARIDRDVLPEKPDLVIWQLGTNSVLRDLDPEIEADIARRGIERLRASGADIMLMDLQYAPAVLVHARYREMEHVLAGVAWSEDVPLFHRFAVMRHWAEDGQITLPAMLSRDRLHMNDTSYDCLARQVAHSISAAIAEETPIAARE